MSLWKQFTNSLSLRADGGLGVQLPPWDDYWYTNRGYQTATGLRVSPESALRIAAVFACVRVTSETIASLPCIIYRRLPNGGKERATDHPLYELLHDAPNQWQTSFEFLEMMQAHLELRGNAYAAIVTGNGRAIDALIPIHPDRVVVKRLPDTGRLKYEVRNFYTGGLEVYAQEEMLHFRGLSADGLVGMSTISVMAEAIGAGLAAQEFAARFFENDSTPSGVMIHPKTLSESAHERIKKSWRDQHSGANQHSVGILEEGMSYTNIGMTNKDSQLLEARQFSRNDIAAGFRVPPHKIGDLTRSTFSNIEQQNIEFATDCIRPRLVRLERRLNVSLIDPLDLDTDEYFAEFLMEGLLRGDQESRYKAYAIGRNWGWLSANDVLAKESMNPIDGGDVYLTPLNMQSAGIDNSDLAAPPADDSTGGGGGAYRLREFVQAAAERVVRKEVKALRHAEKRDTALQFTSEVSSFYETHGSYVAEMMRIREDDGREYAARNRASVLSDVNAISRIEQCATDELCALALKGLVARGQLSINGAREALSLPPIQVTIEPQTINVTPQISVAPPAVSIQPLEVNMHMAMDQSAQSAISKKKVTAVRNPVDGSFQMTMEQPIISKKVTMLRSSNGSLSAVLEEEAGDK